MQMIELLGEAPDRTLSLTDIADTLSLDRGTCANLLKTLSSRGFVQQDAPRSGYKLGYRLYHLTGRSVENEELVKIARKDIDTLGSQLNEVALLSIIRNDKRVTLYTTTPNRAIMVRTSVEKSVYSACTGRVILANYSPSHLEKTLIRLGLPIKEEWPEIYAEGDPGKALPNALTKIKQSGYARQLDAEGIIGFAAPLWRDGHVVGGVGAYLPLSRFNDDGTVLRAVMDAAAAINLKLENSHHSR